MMSHEKLVKKMLNNPKVKAEYEALAPEFALFEQMVKARKNANLTQEDIAKRMKTTKSVVSRLEGFNNLHQNSPSLNTLRRYAEAVGCSLEINFKPKN